MNKTEKELANCTDCNEVHEHANTAHQPAGNEFNDDAWFQKMSEFIIESCQIKFTYDKSGKPTNIIMTKANFDQLLNMHFNLMKSKMVLDAFTKAQERAKETNDEQYALAQKTSVEQVTL